MRFEWSPFPCLNCKDGIANEEAVAEKEGDRLGDDIVPQHNRQKVAKVTYCADCGKPAARDAVRCRACYDEYRNMAI